MGYESYQNTHKAVLLESSDVKLMLSDIIIAHPVNFCNNYGEKGGEKMPETWTGRLVGKMHNNDISYEELAQELGITKAYVCMILRSHRRPEGIKTRMNTAVDAIIARRKENP